MASILPDGRITAPLTLRAPAGGPFSASNLIVDTGAELSAVPCPTAVAKAPGVRISGPAITQHIGGTSYPTMSLVGAAAEVDVEPHGSGTASVTSFPGPVPVHFLTLPTPPFVAFDGLLGMDLLDGFAADAVKDLAASRAYLAERR